MNSEEIKQTNIYNYFTNNKRTSTNFRTLDDKYNNELFKKQISKKDKSEAFANKNSNLKIKDFFTFKEFPEEIIVIQKDLKNMHILSDTNNNKTGPVDAFKFKGKISEFNPFIESNSFNKNENLNSSKSENLSGNTANVFNVGNNFNPNNNANNNFSTLNNTQNLNTQAKEKKQNYGISKYFPILESREELRLFRQNNINNSSYNNNNLNLNSNILLDGINSQNNNSNGEIEKVFILDHFSNKSENLTESANKLNIELTHSLENSGNIALNSLISNLNFEKENLLNGNSNQNNKAKDKGSNLNSNNEDVDMLITNSNSVVDNNSIGNAKNKSSLFSNSFPNTNLNHKKNLTVTSNPFLLNLNTKNKYQDTKITKYIHIQDPPNMKLNRELLVNVLEFIDLRHLIRKVPVICRFWNDLYNKTISSASYNVKLDFTDISKINEKEIHILFKKGKNLKHIKLLKEIIAEDFGGNKGVENFFKKIALIMTLADPKEIHHKGIMLSSFKLRPRRPNEMNNFISTKSVNLICEASKYSLRTLVLRNCSKLTNKVFDGISSCIFLTTLEVSFNDLIDDEGLVKLADKCKDLKSLNLTNLSKITERSVRAIAMKMSFLESIDLSECLMITGTDIYYLKNLKNLKLLLLKSIKFCDNEMIFLEYLKNLNTLSLANAQNLTDGSLDLISKKCPSLLNLDLTKNDSFTEEKVYKFINDLPNLLNLKIDEKYQSNRIKMLLRRRTQS